MQSKSTRGGLTVGGVCSSVPLDIQVRTQRNPNKSRLYRDKDRKKYNLYKRRATLPVVVVTVEAVQVQSERRRECGTHARHVAATPPNILTADER